MSPCRRDLQCAFGVFLAAYVREIGPTGRPNAVGRRLIDLEGVSVDGGHAARPGEYLLFAAQVRHGLRQGADGNHLDIVHEPGLAGVRLRDEDSLEALLLGDGGHRQDAVGVPELTVQGQLAEEHGQRRRTGELPRSHQDGQGYRQIVGRTCLSQVGGREACRDAAHWELTAGVPNGGADALTSLLDRSVRQPHDVERGQSGRDVHLDLDDVPIKSDYGAGQCLSEHVHFP